MNWRQKKAANPKRPITWKIVEQNKWSQKISESNYMFVVIEPLPDNKYKLKYVDAEIKDYDKEEKNFIREKYNLAPHSNRSLALKLTEHYDHYEWIETVNSKEELCDKLENETSFILSSLSKLVEFDSCVV